MHMYRYIVYKIWAFLRIQYYTLIGCANKYQIALFVQQLEIGQNNDSSTMTATTECYFQAVCTCTISTHCNKPWPHTFYQHSLKVDIEEETDECCWPNIHTHSNSRHILAELHQSQPCCDRVLRKWCTNAELYSLCFKVHHLAATEFSILKGDLVILTLVLGTKKFLATFSCTHFSIHHK